MRKTTTDTERREQIEVTLKTAAGSAATWVYGGMSSEDAVRKALASKQFDQGQEIASIWVAVDGLPFALLVKLGCTVKTQAGRIATVERINRDGSLVAWFVGTDTEDIVEISQFEID